MRKNTQPNTFDPAALGGTSQWLGEALWPPQQLAGLPGSLARLVVPLLRFRGWGERWAAPRGEKRKGKEAAATDEANERVDFLNYRIMPVIPAFEGLGE